MSFLDLTPEERIKAYGFDCLDLANVIYFNSENREHLLQLRDKAEKGNYFKFDPDFFNYDRYEAIKSKIALFLSLRGFGDFSDDKVVSISFAFSPSEPLLTLHHLMFVSCLKALGSQEQNDKWLGDCMNYKIIGCYAQTEIAHGSDIQNLQTTATFDMQTDEFILNSPTVLACKFWPGDLGIFANHALVFAIMNVGEINYGLQVFMVPIRDLVTHEPFPGVVAGDIGPKYGYKTKDNGFLRFENFRIPRYNLLSKYTKLSADGEFNIEGNPKILYAIMMKLRCLLSEFAPRLLTSIIGQSYYSECRKSKNQTNLLDDENYFQLLTKSLAINFTHLIQAKNLLELADSNLKAIEEFGDFSLLAETHIQLAGSKAVNTSEALNCMYEILKYGGANLVSFYSNLPNILVSHAPNVTLEGENTVMLMQVANYLMKVVQQVNDGKYKKLNSSSSYLAEINSAKRRSQAVNSLWFTKLENTKILLENSVLNSIKACFDQMKEQEQNYPDSIDIQNNKTGIEMAKAAKNHILYLSFCAMNKEIETIKNPIVKEILENLSILNVLYSIRSNPEFVICSNFLSNKQFGYLDKAIVEVNKSLKPFIEGIFASFNLSDFTLQSAFSSQDNKPYQKLIEYCKSQKTFNDMTPDIIEAGKVVKNMRNFQPRL